jgi:outer membrane immunogenic protein
MQRMKKTRFFSPVLPVVYCILFATTAASQSNSRLEVGANYNYARTNAAPGNCGCIGLQGGNGWVSVNLLRSLDAVGEVGSEYTSNITPFAANLTVTSYMGGVRYKREVRSHFSPFAQVVVGGAHASGSMAPGNSGIPGSSNAFAMAAGGGIDLEFSRIFGLRLFQADYYYTRFPNGVNDHQNNLRIGAGVVVRFGNR